MGLYGRLRRRLAVLALGGAALLSALAARPAAAAAALWKAEAPGGGTAYLFGTFHLIKPGMVWDTQKVETAFASAQELWLEIKNVDDPQSIQPLVIEYGLDRAHPLSSKLDAGDKAMLAKDAAALGMPVSQFEPFRPWFAAMELSLAPMMKAGYAPQSGVDVSLKAKADARNEPVEAFETAEEQLRYFADLSPQLELKYLHQTLEDFDLDMKDLDEASADWEKGDVAGIDRVMIEKMRAEAPELYDVLLKQRNAAMAGKIVERLKAGGTIFVAVGAGHLAGPDAIQALLRQRGVKVTRL